MLGVRSDLKTKSGDINSKILKLIRKGTKPFFKICLHHPGLFFEIPKNIFKNTFVNQLKNPRICSNKGRRRITLDDLKKHAGLIGIDLIGIASYQNESLIIFAVEMKKYSLNGFLSIGIESWKIYVESMKGQYQLSDYLQRLGYKTRLHIPFSLDLPLIEIAQMANLGKKGLNNLLVTKEFGSRVRLVAIGIDLPAEQGKEVPFEIEIEPVKYSRVCPFGAIDESGYSYNRCFKKSFNKNYGCGKCLLAYEK